MAITQDLSPVPTPVPNRSSQTQSEFDAASDALFQWLEGLPGEANTWATQANALADAADADATAAQASRLAAEDAENGALAAAQFKGSWAALSGALARPATVRHSDAYWLLLPASLPNVAASEPGDSNTDWARLSVGGGIIALSGPTSAYITSTTEWEILDHDAFSTYSASASAGSISIAGSTISYTAPETDQTVTLTLTVNGQARAISLSILPAGIATPTNSSPANGATNIGASPALASSAFSPVGLSDAHAFSRWRVYQGATLIHDSGWSASALTGYSVPAGVVATSQAYTWTVEHRGATLGDSAPSIATGFTTASAFSGAIGTQGTQGFGVGIYPGTLPSGFSALTGTADMASANYGNYQTTNGSIMVFVPKFFYRIGSTSSPRYATHGANALDIVGIEAYASEAAANAAGFALHRAFIDGGSEKSGFFLDKYLASKDGTTSCKSVQNGNPISLTTNTSYNPSNGMTGCTGILADAVVLARARGAGTFNVASAFMYSAIALLSLAHAQAATSATHCAWYDAAGTTNFPKGCNSSLADTNDSSVTFTTAGVSGDTKPLTGSASNLAKTTHNGQLCGVADLNGAMWQVLLGITRPGTSATDTTQNTTGDAYILKRSVALASLTGGWNGANDAWGDATNLATKYDLITGLFPWGSTTGNTYFGNGTNQVFSGATSGTSYSRTSGGIQDTTNSTSAAGTNQFGNDQCYQYNRANLFPLASGDWYVAASAGVFCRGWLNGRSSDNSTVGFRAAAYGS